MKKTQIQPSMFEPRSPADFIGAAGDIARIFERKSSTMRAARSGAFKGLLYGPPGVGKTKLAEMFAVQMAGHQTCIESTNGRNVDIGLVRKWQEASHYLPLYGLFNVKIVNELGTASAAALDLLLTYLDEMPACTVFIGTCNMEESGLFNERFQSRLQQFHVKAPSTEEIIALLRRWKVRDNIIKQTAVGCGGNVRAALLDLQSVIDAEQ